MSHCLTQRPSLTCKESGLVIRGVAAGGDELGDGLDVVLQRGHGHEGEVAVPVHVLLLALALVALRHHPAHLICHISPTLHDDKVSFSIKPNLLIVMLLAISISIRHEHSPGHQQRGEEEEWESHCRRHEDAHCFCKTEGSREEQLL